MLLSSSLTPHSDFSSRSRFCHSHFYLTLFLSTNWPSQAGPGLYISGFEATSETKAKLWVWFGTGRAHWPRHVVSVGQTAERGEVGRRICANLTVYLKKTPTTANLNVSLSGGGRSKLGPTSDGVKSTCRPKHHLLFLFWGGVTLGRWPLE